MTAKKAAKKVAKKAAKKTETKKKEVYVTVQVQGGEPRRIKASTVAEARMAVDVSETYKATINGRPARRPSDELKDGNFVSFTTKVTHG